MLSATLLSACSSGALIGAVGASPERITPNGDRVDDTAAIAYTLSRPARISIYLLDAGNARFPLREDLRRPAGAYEAAFDGTVATGSDPAQRQMLAAGEYRFVVEAVDEAGRREQREGKLVLAEPDRASPSLESVVADPASISPYDPAMQSQTRVSYRLSKAATVTLFVAEPDGRRTRIAEPLRREPGEYAETWNGLVRNKVPAAGTYNLIVQAKDAAGNATEKGVAVAISGTEEPDATIVRVTFSPRNVMEGDVLKVAITVRNTGSVTLRSHGPDSGFTYTTLDTFASIEGGRYADKANYWRVGVDWAGGLGPEGSRYPYRWGLGKDLAPGEETTVEGYIRILDTDPNLRFYAGLIHEKVKYHVDRVGQQVIEVSK
jgi:hypothetical protein